MGVLWSAAWNFKDQTNLFDLRRQIFRKQGLSSADDAAVDDRRQLLKLLDAALVVSVGGVGVAASEDRVLELLPEMSRGAEDSFVDEVDKREILKKVVLDRGAWQQDPSFCFEAHESLVGLVFRVFQAVAFVAQNKPDLTLVQNGRVESESLVGKNLKNGDRVDTQVLDVGEFESQASRKLNRSNSFMGWSMK